MISRVRRKLEAAGINPETLPVMSRGAIRNTTEVKLNVAKVHLQGELKELHPDDELWALKEKGKSIRTPLSLDKQITDDVIEGGDLREEIEDF